MNFPLEKQNLGYCLTEIDLDKKLVSEFEIGRKERLKSVILNVTDIEISRHIARISSFNTNMITCMSLTDLGHCVSTKTLPY